MSMLKNLCDRLPFPLSNNLISHLCRIRDGINGTLPPLLQLLFGVLLQCPLGCQSMSM